ncbi:unnamed protein product [Dibothriocephalus latus]|uniref:Uncharacterized protein n=1 Tax=Dibothriocephalus latus TaxID=60516 RepID=A0A3P6T202_DIBLA|nr:unnamed protein product [Dibothriocephalus latus]
MAHTSSVCALLNTRPSGEQRMKLMQYMSILTTIQDGSTSLYLSAEEDTVDVIENNDRNFVCVVVFNVVHPGDDRLVPDLIERTLCLYLPPLSSTLLLRPGV